MAFRHNISFISQITTSGTNFLSSIVAVRFLESNDLRIWALYIPITLVIQGIMRAIFYEIDLIRQKHLSKISLIAFLISILILPSIGILNMKINQNSNFGVNFEFTLICTLILFQDFLRYTHIMFLPTKVLISDSILFIFSLLSFLMYALGIKSWSNNSTWSICNLVGLAIAISTIVKFKLELAFKFQIKTGSYRRLNLFLPNFFLLTSSILTNSFVTLFLNDELLRKFRTLNILQNIFFAIVFAIWFKNISNAHSTKIGINRNISDKKKLLSILYVIFILLITNLFFVESKTFENFYILLVLIIVPPTLNLINNQIEIFIKSLDTFTGYQLVAINYLITPILIYTLREQLNLTILLGSSALSALFYSYFLILYLNFRIGKGVDN